MRKTEETTLEAGLQMVGQLKVALKWELRVILGGMMLLALGGASYARTANASTDAVGSVAAGVIPVLPPPTVPAWTADGAMAPAVEERLKMVRSPERASRSAANGRSNKQPNPRHPNVESVVPSPPQATSLGGTFACIRHWETLGHSNPYTTRASNGHYGAYQFSIATWRSVGGSGNPADASPAEQDMRAQMLQARSGWGQWQVHNLCGV